MAKIAPKTKRRVVMLAYPNVVLLDIAGPCEVFAMANHICRKLDNGAADPYRLEVVSTSMAVHCRSANGLMLRADCGLADASTEIDTLLVPGGMDMEAIVGDEVLRAWLQETSPRVRRIGSICTGAFILAAAGLLKNRIATTHWMDCENLARRYPDIRVEPDRIYVKDGNVYTSAGVTAGMDLALAMIEEDLGRDLALSVARTLVMFVQRLGGQSQFSTVLEAQGAQRQPMRDLIIWAAEHPSEDLSVESLANRVNMSVRNFSRAFRRDLGSSPARFIENLRVEAAKRMLEETDHGLDRIARDCGLGGANSIRRSFLRVLGVQPSRYRRDVSSHP